MATIKKIVKNTRNYLIGQLLYNFINFIILIYIARYLGSEGYGIYSYVITYLFFFEVFSSLGINLIVVREVSKERSASGKIIGNAIILKIILSVIAIISSIIITNMMNNSPEIKVLTAIASITVLFSSIRAVSASVFQADYKLEYLILGNLTEVIIFGINILIIVFLNYGLNSIIVAFIFSKLVGLFVTLFYSRKFTNYDFKLDTVFCKNLIFDSIPVGITVVLRAIYYRINLIILFSMKTSAEVGLYSSALTLVSSLSIIPTSIMLSLFPMFSEYAKNSNEKLMKLYEKSFKLLIIISIPLAINIAYFSKDIIRLTYGQEFIDASFSLTILIWSQVFAFLNSLFQNVVVAVGKQKISAYMAMFMAIFNIIVSYLLIPQYSLLGASIAIVLTEALGTFFGYIYINTFLIRKNFYSYVIKVLLINIFLIFLIIILNDLLPFYILIIIYFVSYILVTHKIKDLNIIAILYKKEI